MSEPRRTTPSSYTRTTFRERRRNIHTFPYKRGRGGRHRYAAYTQEARKVAFFMLRTGEQLYCWGRKNTRIEPNEKSPLSAVNFLLGPRAAALLPHSLSLSSYLRATTGCRLLTRLSLTYDYRYSDRGCSVRLQATFSTPCVCYTIR